MRLVLSTLRVAVVRLSLKRAALRGKQRQHCTVAGDADRVMLLLNPLTSALRMTTRLESR